MHGFIGTVIACVLSRTRVYSSEHDEDIFQVFATDLLSSSLSLFTPRAPAVPAANGHALQLPVPSVSLYVPGFRLIRNVMAENERNVTQACWRNYEQDPYLSDSYVPNVIVHACAHRPHQQDSLNMTETRSAT